jgi:hypothetical protein
MAMPLTSKKIKPCPSRQELELFCLKANLSRNERLRVQRHVATCPACRRSYRALDRFYDFLNREIQKPVDSSVLDMAKEIAPHSVRFGLIICTPAPELDIKATKAYRTQLVFSANGDAGRRRLDDYNLKKIAGNQVALRVFTDPVYKEMSVYVWRHSGTEDQRLCLRWSGKAKTLLLSPNGSSSMALTDLAELDNRVFYLIQAKYLQKSSTTKSSLPRAKGR